MSLRNSQEVNAAGDECAMEGYHRIKCHGSLSAGWKRISRHRPFQKGVSFLKTKGRDKAGSASAMGPHLHRPGDADSFHELIANFYSLKAKLLLDG